MKCIVIIFSAFLMSVSLKAQDLQGLSTDRLRPLDSLLKEAIEKAPLIQRLSKGQEQKLEEISLSRKAWLQHIALTGGYNYGNGVVADNLTTSVDNQRIWRTSNFSTFSVGVQLRLPLSELTNQGNRVKISQLAIEEMEFQKEDLRNVITEEVIKRYNNLERTLKTIKLQALKVEADEAAVQVTESYFKQGTADIDEYRMAMDILTTAQIELEKSKSDAWYYKRTLEEIVGSPIFY